MAVFAKDPTLTPTALLLTLPAAAPASPRSTRCSQRTATMAAVREASTSKSQIPDNGWWPEGPRTLFSTFLSNGESRTSPGTLWCRVLRAPKLAVKNKIQSLPLRRFLSTSVQSVPDGSQYKLEHLPLGSGRWKLLSDEPASQRYSSKLRRQQWRVEQVLEVVGLQPLQVLQVPFHCRQTKQRCLQREYHGCRWNHCSKKKPRRGDQVLVDHREGARRAGPSHSTVHSHF